MDSVPPPMAANPPTADPLPSPTGPLLHLLSQCDSAFFATLLFALVAQLLASWFFYGMCFASQWSHYAAADKGVRRFENVRFRYSLLSRIMLTCATSVVRALVMIVAIEVMNIQSLEASSLLAAAVSTLVGVAATASSLRAQRPLSLISIEFLHNGLLFFTASSVVFLSTTWSM